MEQKGETKIFFTVHRGNNETKHEDKERISILA